jgi:hypothetical protein
LIHARSITEFSFNWHASLLRDRSRREVAQTNRDGPIIVGVLRNIPQLLRAREERFQQALSH